MVGVEGCAASEVGGGGGGRPPLVDDRGRLGRLTPLHAQPVGGRHARHRELTRVRALHPMCALQHNTPGYTQSYKALVYSGAPWRLRCQHTSMDYHSTILYIAYLINLVFNNPVVSQSTHFVQEKS